MEEDIKRVEEGIRSGTLTCDDFPFRKGNLGVLRGGQGPNTPKKRKTGRFAEVS